MKTIYLPAETVHIPFQELEHLIADALWPETSPDEIRLRYVSARLELKSELKQAVKNGALPVKNRLTFGPHTFPEGNALLSALVTVDDLRKFVADRGLSVILEAPEQAAPAQSAAEPAPVLPVGEVSDIDPTSEPPEWKARAAKRAAEIIASDRKNDLYPSQENIADAIAKEFRAAGVVGAGGKPLTGAYIKRHALKGISSAQKRQLSTSIRRGK